MILGGFLSKSFVFSIDARSNNASHLRSSYQSPPFAETASLDPSECSVSSDIASGAGPGLENANRYSA